MIALPSLVGAVQVRLAESLPGLPPTSVGAPGALCVPEEKTTVAISQIVFAPVPTLAAGVAPADTGWSSASISTSLVGDMFARTDQPLPPVRASPKPESA